MKNHFNMFGAHCTAYYMLLLTLGWWLLAQYLPPHIPSQTPESTIRFYQENQLRIIAGMVVCNFAAIIFIPFTAAVAYRISEIEGRFGVLTLTQIMGGVGTTVLTIYPTMWWLLVCFRPDRAAGDLALFHDMGWMQFVGGLAIYLPQVATVGIAAFLDKRENPVFPRWYGYFNIWAFILYLPGQLIFFFYRGPFAWNGVISFWLALTVLLLWFSSLFYFLVRAASRDDSSQVSPHNRESSVAV